MSFCSVSYLKTTMSDEASFLEVMDWLNHGCLSVMEFFCFSGPSWAWHVQYGYCPCTDLITWLSGEVWALMGTFMCYHKYYCWCHTTLLGWFPRSHLHLHHLIPCAHSTLVAVPFC
jgi:hypothetical protein